jgi:hypothetical protein
MKFLYLIKMSIKVVYDNVIKRISEVYTLSDLKKSIWMIFPELVMCEINVIYIKGVEKVVVATEEEYKYVLLVNKKFYIEKANGVQEVPHNSLVRNHFSVFNSTCSTCSAFPIIGEKYICTICENLDLCKTCEATHNHPMIKLKTDEFQNGPDVYTLIQSNKSLTINTSNQSNKSLISVLRDKISKPKYKVIVEIACRYYVINPNTEFSFQVILYNDGENSLPLDTVVYVKDNKDFFIEMKKIKKILWPGAMEHVDLSCKTGNSYRTYNIEVHLYNKDVKIDYLPLIFTVKVSDSVEGEDTGEVKPYCPDDTVSILPVEKKEVLCEIIKNDYSSKDIRDICRILEKYDWKLTEEALEEIK